MSGCRVLTKNAARSNGMPAAINRPHSSSTNACGAGALCAPSISQEMISLTSFMIRRSLGACAAQRH